jgi:hypothetical protein
MKARLEDVLKEKERELKLYQRFLNLRTVCEEKIFPGIDLPIRNHVETVKDLIEKIIPDPKDRTEEMFSGEIFILLGVLYLHDVKYVRDFPWSVNKEILNTIGGDGKEIFLNYEIGRRLNIPDSAIEIINYLGHSNVVKKVPPEWEIADNGAKAIIRNTKTFEHIFNFAHLLADLFYSDIRYLPLKRYKDPQVVLRPNEASVEIDSKEGIITIRYNITFPYEMHVLENAKRYVENMFVRFKNNVNGRLGCQYRDIVWDITGEFSYNRGIFEKTKFSHYNEFEGPPFERWDETNKILDTLFNNGYAVVVGDISAGKTTVLKSFVISQLSAFSPNVFYCETWSHPANEVRDTINKKLGIAGPAVLDVISLCKKLSDEAPGFFIIDSMEKLLRIDKAEKEKFERFIEYCMGERNIYLIVCGDTETFFEWHPMLHGINTAALCLLQPATDKKIRDELLRKSIDAELLQTSRSLEETLEDILSGLKEDYEFRSMMAFFVDRQENAVSRYSIEEIYAGTLVPGKKITAFTAVLKEKDILRETESQGFVYYSLTNRDLKEMLYKVLKLGDFEGRKKIRNILKDCIVRETLLDDEPLSLVEAWKDHMTFRKDEMGLILGSLIVCGKDHGHLFEKARRDGKGIDIQPLLRLVSVKDVLKRRNVIRLLIDIQDKATINPLLFHLKEEDDIDIRRLIAKGIVLTGKKKAIVAIINTLREKGGDRLRREVIEFFHSYFGDDSRQALLDIRETESDQTIVGRIDQLLSKPAVSG